VSQLALKVQQTRGINRRGASTEVGVSTDVGGSTGREGSTDEGDEVCVSGVFETGLSATRLSLVATGADWG